MPAWPAGRPTAGQQGGEAGLVRRGDRELVACGHSRSTAPRTRSGTPRAAATRPARGRSCSRWPRGRGEQVDRVVGEPLPLGLRPVPGAAGPRGAERHDVVDLHRGRVRLGERHAPPGVRVGEHAGDHRAPAPQLHLGQVAAQDVVPGAAAVAVHVHRPGRPEVAGPLVAAVTRVGDREPGQLAPSPAPPTPPAPSPRARCRSPPARPALRSHRPAAQPAQPVAAQPARSATIPTIRRTYALHRQPRAPCPLPATEPAAKPRSPDRVNRPHHRHRRRLSSVGRAAAL